MSHYLDKEREVCKPFAYTEDLCKGCDRKYHTLYEDVKWFCLGITTFENRKKHEIPELNNLRLCIKDLSSKELSVKGLLLLNLSETDVRELIKGFSQLLKSFV